MKDKEIIKALAWCGKADCVGCPYIHLNCRFEMVRKALDLINRQQAENNRQKAEIEKLQLSRNQELKEIERLKNECFCIANERDAYKDILDTAVTEAIKEFAEKVDELLSRYSHLHKQADEVRQSTEEYADGTPREMVSVWEVLSLKKWEMCDYETMSTLQDNIETIEKARLLSELEKDFMLLKKEMVGTTMPIQLDLYGNEVKVVSTTPVNKAKRNWENAFQRWSNKMAQNETDPLGICGWGSMCDYCKDNTYGKPCVRALNDMCREKEITIDYSNRNFENIWNGVFK